MNKLLLEVQEQSLSLKFSTKVKEACLQKLGLGDAIKCIESINGVGTSVVYSVHRVLQEIISSIDRYT